MSPDATGAPEVVSLFSGAGGLDIGLERAGWVTAVATDLASDSMETLRLSQSRNIGIPGSDRSYLEGTNLLEADIRELSRADLTPEGRPDDWRPDLMVGGPPCQPWSSAGSQRGLSDPRGQLIAHMIRLIGEMRPRYVIFENVRGLVTAGGKDGTPGEMLRSIQSDLQDVGYASRISTLNSADFGAGQRRVRLILLASTDRSLPEYPIPTHDRKGENSRLPWVSLRDMLATVPEPLPEDVVKPSGERAQALELLTPGTGIKTGGRATANRPGGHWGYRQDSFLADLSLPSRTIRAASTPDWVRLPGESMRRLTWRECAVLQGFPTEWQFHGPMSSRFTQIGNAVQVDVAHALGEAIGKALSDDTHTNPTSPAWPSELIKRVRYTENEHRINGRPVPRNSKLLIAAS